MWLSLSVCLSLFLLSVKPIVSLTNSSVWICTSACLSFSTDLLLPVSFFLPILLPHSCSRSVYFAFCCAWPIMWTVHVSSCYSVTFHVQAQEQQRVQQVRSQQRSCKVSVICILLRPSSYTDIRCNNSVHFDLNNFIASCFNNIAWVLFCRVLFVYQQFHDLFSEVI